MSCYIPKQPLSAWQMRQAVKQGVIDAKTQQTEISKEMILAFRYELPNYAEHFSDEAIERGLRAALNKKRNNRYGKY